jgi:hypothetical protein
MHGSATAAAAAESRTPRRLRQFKAI